MDTIREITADMVKGWIETGIALCPGTPKITLHYVLSFFRARSPMTAMEIMSLPDLEPLYKVLILFRPEVLTEEVYQQALTYFDVVSLSHEERLNYLRSVLVDL